MRFFSPLSLSISFALALIFVYLFSEVLPMLRPALVVALIFRTLDTLRIFDLVWIMTGGASGTETMATFNQRHLIQFTKLGFGSTISVMIFVVIAVFVVIYMTTIFKEEV